LQVAVSELMASMRLGFDSESDDFTAKLMDYDHVYSGEPHRNTAPLDQPNVSLSDRPSLLQVRQKSPSVVPAWVC